MFKTMRKLRWFEKNSLNDEEYVEFMKKINRCREPFLKAQYLKIQAGWLLKNDDMEQQKIGKSLMSKLFADYPEDFFNVITGHINLGVYYSRNKQYEEALNEFEIVRCYEKKNRELEGKKLTISSYPEMRIAETIIRMKDKSKYGYAKELMRSVNTRALFLQEEKEWYERIMQELA